MECRNKTSADGLGATWSSPPVFPMQRSDVLEFEVYFFQYFEWKFRHSLSTVLHHSRCS
jgi:hypothetical protein